MKDFCRMSTKEKHELLDNKKRMMYDEWKKIKSKERDLKKREKRIAAIERKVIQDAYIRWDTDKYKTTSKPPFKEHTTISWRPWLKSKLYYEICCFLMSDEFLYKFPNIITFDWRSVSGRSAFSLNNVWIVATNIIHKFNKEKSKDKLYNTTNAYLGTSHIADVLTQMLDYYYSYKEQLDIESNIPDWLYIRKKKKWSWKIRSKGKKKERKKISINAEPTLSDDQKIKEDVEENIEDVDNDTNDDTPYMSVSDMILSKLDGKDTPKKKRKKSEVNVYFDSIIDSVNEEMGEKRDDTFSEDNIEEENIVDDRDNEEVVEENEDKEEQEEEDTNKKQEDSKTITDFSSFIK